MFTMLKTACNIEFSYQVIQAALNCGVEHFCLCMGSRNAPFIDLLSRENLQVYDGFEERSTAFFALGKIKRFKKPVAIITTSGTAAAEIFPAAIEAYYSGLPLLIITADRPHSYRGTGAPQTIDQTDLFGNYVSFTQDIAIGEMPKLETWDQRAPAHLNVCFDDPLLPSTDKSHSLTIRPHSLSRAPCDLDPSLLNAFLKENDYPLVIVGTLPAETKEKVIEFLLGLNCPIIAEATSGIREAPSIQHLIIRRRHAILENAKQNNYPVDAILRVGGVPTLRLWRDLETTPLNVLSISHLPFTGLSHSQCLCVDLEAFFAANPPCRSFTSQHWVESDQLYDHSLHSLITKEPQAEASLFYQLSSKLPMRSSIYIGNSLPIRQWDLTATYEARQYDVRASRGANGIDGQISTFLGYCDRGIDSWGIFGDLTTLYDLSSPWLLQHNPQIVVINNFGGKIFQRLYSNPFFQNQHNIHFEHFAKMWNLDYERWEQIPDDIQSNKPRIIEIRPSNEASELFWANIKEF